MFNLNKKTKCNKNNILNITNDCINTNIENLETIYRSKNVNYLFPYKLDKNYNTLLNGNINIVFYNINKQLYLPFIQYLLFYSNKTYDFLKVNYSDNNSIDNLIIDINKLLKKNNINLQELIFKGFLDYNNEKYIILEIILSKYNNNIVNNNYCYEFVTVYEILNSHFVYDILINNSVELFFTSNSSLLYLYKTNNSCIQNPIVMYGYDIPINHFYHLKRGRENENGIIGKGYYFTTYSNCIKKINRDNIIYRYVIQPNKIKYIFNKEDLDFYRNKWNNNFDGIFINLDYSHLIIKNNNDHIVLGYNAKVS